MKGLLWTGWVSLNKILAFYPDGVELKATAIPFTKRYCLALIRLPEKRKPAGEREKV